MQDFFDIEKKIDLSCMYGNCQMKDTVLFMIIQTYLWRISQKK